MTVCIVKKASTIRKVEAAVGGKTRVVFTRGGWGHNYFAKLESDSDHYYVVNMRDWGVQKKSTRA